jgi:tetratricopeptide (TPR) repeat protein
MPGRVLNPPDRTRLFQCSSSALARRLVQRGEYGEAVDLLVRTESQGDCRAAGCLGEILEELGDPEGAEQAYRRALESTDAFNIVAGSRLGYRLEERGDVDGAELVYQQMERNGWPDGPLQLGRLYESRGDSTGAEDACWRAYGLRSIRAAVRLAGLSIDRGGLEEAEEMLRWPDDCGSAEAACWLGWVYEQDPELRPAAEAAYGRAADRGNAWAALHLGLLLAKDERHADAMAAFERADHLGDGDGALRLGLLLEERGDFAGAEAAYRRPDERGHPYGAFTIASTIQASSAGRSPPTDRARRKPASHRSGTQTLCRALASRALRSRPSPTLLQPAARPLPMHPHPLVLRCGGRACGEYQGAIKRAQDTWIGGIAIFRPTAQSA